MPLFRRGDRRTDQPDRAAAPAAAPPPTPSPPGAPLSPGGTFAPPSPTYRPPPAPSSPVPSPASTAPTVARFPVTEGDLPCRARGCANHNGVLCHYIDRRGRRCDTAWCPNHWATVGGIVYCRRHAGTIAAIGYFDHPAGMPDVDNRAPSLVNWVARDLDAFVAATLVQVRDPGGDLRAGAGGVHPRRPSRRRDATSAAGSWSTTPASGWSWPSSSTRPRTPRSGCGSARGWSPRACRRGSSATGGGSRSPTRPTGASGRSSTPSSRSTSWPRSGPIGSVDQDLRQR